ncbi:hypothetical protein [Shinella sp.]|uniref:hypothetical protein n=1 Tax=Shinella sp. TaxID=1870904 RepID=UPI0028985B86|nr:hypothetical protein [Shinella sp.]
MKHPVSDELLICDSCGARIALGKYAPLARHGNDECASDPRKVSTEEADALLDLHVAATSRNALDKERGE